MGRSVRLSETHRSAITNAGMRAFDIAYEPPAIVGDLAERAAEAVTRLKGQDEYQRLRTLATKIRLNTRSIRGSCRQEAVQEFLDRSDKKICDTVTIQLSPEHKGVQKWQEHTIALPVPVTIPYAAPNRYARGQAQNNYKVYTNELQDEDLLYLTQAIGKTILLKEEWDAKRRGYKAQLRRLVELSNSTRQLINRLPVAENWLPAELIAKMHQEANNGDTPATEEALAALDIDESLFKQTHVIAKVIGT